MAQNDFQSKLRTLIDQLQSVPEADRPELERLVDETKDRHERIQGSVKQLQDSLDYLRLSVKYLVFDLEATRRENAYLRGLLSDQVGEPGVHDERADDLEDGGTDNTHGAD